MEESREGSGWGQEGSERVNKAQMTLCSVMTIADRWLKQPNKGVSG